MKILIHAPSDTTAGGCESIHQLCDALSQNFETNICYYFNSDSEIPDKFKIYKIKKSNFFDDAKTIHIIPESAVKYFYKKITLGIKVIFWLSVDNYLGLKDYSQLFKLIKYIKSFNNRISIRKLNNCYHLSQSEYASLFLEKKKISHFFVGDYINQNYSNLYIDHNKKKNLIIYNPRKGMHLSSKIMDKSSFNFVPIKNMNNQQIIQLMKESKIYIDFGRFPGRDRIPREAVLLDMVIIIGNRGSAINDVDFPIHKNFKVDANDTDFKKDVNNIIQTTLNNYSNEVKKFEKFKNQLILEKENFKFRAINALKKIINRHY